MAIYNIHAGHANAGGLGCGSVGILDESAEARKVKDLVIKYLKAAGHTVYDNTYNGNAAQGTVLAEIVKKCNAHTVNLDISIHLNSGRNDYKGDGSTGGVEVWGYDTGTQTIGAEICKKISESLGIRNRGFKTNKDLYVLRKTKAAAIIVECCFVDDKDDAAHWNVDKCARAIVEGITRKSVTVSNTSQAAGNTSSNASQSKPSQAAGATQYYTKYTGNSSSIVDALKAINVDSSFNSRKTIATKNGIKNYVGTAEQNTNLLRLLKAGKLIK